MKYVILAAMMVGCAMQASTAQYYQPVPQYQQVQPIPMPQRYQPAPVPQYQYSPLQQQQDQQRSYNIQAQHMLGHMLSSP